MSESMVQRVAKAIMDTDDRLSKPSGISYSGALVIARAAIEAALHDLEQRRT